MASGDTKTEALLNILGNGGDASDYRGCCNTKTQSYILDAIDRVQNVEDEVEELKNNPDVVDIVDTYADLQAYDTQHLSDNDIIRVLADETHSGNSTYYKFNKQAGTWTFIGEIAAGGGGGVTELTSADYNYPSNNPTSIAAWLLDDGIYSTKSAGVMFDAYSSRVYSTSFMVATDSSDMKYAIIFNDIEGGYIRQTGVNSTNANRILTDKNLKQTTGTSTTNVMSQDATTKMVFDTSVQGETIGWRVKIGSNTSTGGNQGVAIGANASASGSGAIALGPNAVASAPQSISFAQGVASTTGEFNIGTGDWTGGYNSSKYRLLTGLYDGQNAHDAATVAQGNTLSTSAPTTSTVGVLGQLYTDTTGMHTYQLGSIDTTDPSNPVYNWVQRW